MNVTLAAEMRILSRHNATHRVVVGHGFDLLVVLGFGQEPQPFRGKFTTRRIEGAAIGSAQVSTKGVDGDDKGPSVRLELCENMYFSALILRHVGLLKAACLNVYFKKC